MAYDKGLADRVRLILGNQRGEIEERSMFGGVAFMLNGHMCCGITKSDLMLRLSVASVNAALRRPHTRPMDFTGKPMKSMVFVDPQGTDSEESLRHWVDAAVSFVSTLPPK